MAVAMAPAADVTSVAHGAERGRQLLFDRDLDHPPDGFVDQGAERPRAAVLPAAIRPLTLT